MHCRECGLLSLSEMILRCQLRRQAVRCQLRMRWHFKLTHDYELLRVTEEKCLAVLLLRFLHGDVGVRSGARHIGWFVDVEADWPVYLLRLEY